MDEKSLKNILEAGLLVAARTMSIAQLEALFHNDAEKPGRKQIRAALESLKEDYQGRGIELVEVASGFRLQSHASVSDWVSNLFQEKAPRYSRALLETLVLIAYRQPITRAEIEDVRGVAVSSNIIKTLQERQWVKVLGHKEVPGRPALLGTTKEFLDYFNLKKLDDLPALADIKDLDQFDELLAEEVGEVGEQGDAANDDGGNVNAPANDSQTTNPDNQTGTDNQLHDDSESANHTGSEQSLGLPQKQSQDQSETDRIKRMSAKLDLDVAHDANLEASQEQTEPADNRGTDDVDDNSDQKIDSDDDMSAAERKLLRVISDFSEEHQQEVDARDELEAGILSRERDDLSETDLGDMSQRVGDDKQPGGMPDPGDTLH